MNLKDNNILNPIIKCFMLAFMFYAFTQNLQQGVQASDQRVQRNNSPTIHSDVRTLVYIQMYLLKVLHIFGCRFV